MAQSEHDARPVEVDLDAEVLQWAVAPCSTRVLTRADELDAIADDWARLLSDKSGYCAEQDLAFLRRDYPDRDGRSMVRAVVVERNGQVVGVAPLVLLQHVVTWKIRLLRRHITLLRFNVQGARFVGDSFIGARDPVAQRALLDGLLHACEQFDVVRFQYTRVDAEPCMTLTSSRHTGHWIWPTERDTPILTIRLSDDYGTYLRDNLSHKRRHNIRRETKMLEKEEGGPLRMEVSTRPDQVARFLDLVDRVFSRSWHVARGANPIRRSETQERLEWLAERGWLRCYMLFKGDEPVSFVLGRQHGGSFRALRTAYVASLAPYSPGKVLWFKVVEDLHRAGEFNELDFGYGDWEYKRIMANGRRTARSFDVVKPSVRNALIWSGPVVYAKLRIGVITRMERSGFSDAVARWSRKHLAR